MQTLCAYIAMATVALQLAGVAFLVWQDNIAVFENGIVSYLLDFFLAIDMMITLGGLVFMIAFLILVIYEGFL